MPCLSLSRPAASLLLLTTLAAATGLATARGVRGQHGLGHGALNAQSPLKDLEASTVPKLFSADHCAVLQQAIALEPRPSCQHVPLPGGWASCSCQVKLPENVNPMIGGFIGAADGNAASATAMPVAEALPTLSPLQPVVAAPARPECPFSTRCSDVKAQEGEAAACVGFDSWGFEEARMEEVTAASAYLQTVGCDYIMKPNGHFAVPLRVTAFWRVQEARKRPTGVECGPQSGLHVAKTDSFESFCRYTLYHLKASCDFSWEQALGSACQGAAAPAGFSAHSPLRDVCPVECGADLLEVAARLHQVPVEAAAAA